MTCDVFYRLVFVMQCEMCYFTAAWTTAYTKTSGKPSEPTVSFTTLQPTNLSSWSVTVVLTTLITFRISYSQQPCWSLGFKKLFWISVWFCLIVNNAMGRYKPGSQHICIRVLGFCFNWENELYVSRIIQCHSNPEPVVWSCQVTSVRVRIRKCGTTLTKFPCP